MKRNDFILIGIILAAAAAILLYRNATKEKGDMVVIKVGGEIYKELPLNQDATIEITGVNGGKNLLVIKDGYADIIEATCPDKLCVKQRHIRYNRESLVCLPNQVIVEIHSETENEVDVIAN